VLPQDAELSRLRTSSDRTQDPRLPFLGEIERTIPWSRPASGGAPRTGLVQDAACGTGAQRRLVLDETEHGAILSRSGHQSIIEIRDPVGQLPESTDRPTKYRVATIT